MARQWGKYKGEKPIAILYAGTIITESSKMYDIGGVTSTSAAQRLLKAETGRVYDVVNVDYNGEFRAETHIARKVENCLSRLLYGKEVLFSTIV